MTTIKNYIQAARRRREDGSDEGFSLIELIVVVAILGILVAIAIPVFGAIQGTAQTNAAKASAQNGATSAAAQIASGEEATLNDDEGDIELAWFETVGDVAPISIDDICVMATYGGGEPQYAGPGCDAPTTP